MISTIYAILILYVINYQSRIKFYNETKNLVDAKFEDMLLMEMAFQVNGLDH